MSALAVSSERLTRPGRDERRAERRRLKSQDAVSRRLAELHAMGALLERAADVVGAGWVQGAWFTVATPGGKRDVTAYDLPMMVHALAFTPCSTRRSLLACRAAPVVWRSCWR